MKQLETEFFEQVKEGIDEFEIAPDSQGNYSWPDDFTDALRGQLTALSCTPRRIAA